MSCNAQNKLFKTNNYSIISKYSCVKEGYQRDVVLKSFIEDWLNIRSWRRTTLVNRGYAARMMAIDWIVNRSIKFEGVDCFIVLGAGFDFLPLRQETCSQSLWIELDLAEVVSTKSEYIQAKRVLGDNDELIQVKDGFFSSSSLKYHLIECDLRNSETLASRLEEVFSSLEINRTKPKNVAILNEVCLCYIDFDENQKILSTVIETVQEFALRVYYIGYEQYKPHEKSPFNDVMSEHFSSMSYPLKHFPTRNQLKQLFLENLNFNHLTITPIYQIYQNALEQERETFKEAYQGQPFDEYEELSLYLSHYALVTGVLILHDPFSSISTSHVVSNTTDSNREREQLADGLSEMTLESTEGNTKFVPFQLERYGHSSCSIEAFDGHYSIFVSGGFGQSLGKKEMPHRRLNDCAVIKSSKSGQANEKLDLKVVGTENINPNSVRLDRMHGQVMHLGGNGLFFIGGRQNPNRKDTLNASFTAKLIDDEELKIIHTFQQVAETDRWRHKLCPQGGPEQFIQVGGLSSFDYANPVVMWNLSSDKLGVHVIRCRDIDLFRRHSFALDARDQTTIFLMGGLQAFNSTKDRQVDAGGNTILWDTRQAEAQVMSYECANCYGSSIHFVNEFQLIKLGGISTKTGLAETSLQLLDLRNKKLAPIAEDLLPLADQRMILANTGYCHSKSSREIITTGGGGNYFTFGTRFNKSQLVYKYTT